MSDAIDLQPAFVLHGRPFGNSSLIVDFFTLDHGRVRAMARAARGSRSPYRLRLQPFVPLLISARGRSELLNLQAAERSVAGLDLKGMRLFSGLYANELLMRLLPSRESHSSLFVAYRQLLTALHGDSDVEPSLREFELILLQELGYGVDLFYAQPDGEAIASGQRYLFTAARGLEPVQGNDSPGADSVIVQGSDVIAMREHQWQQASTRRAAKRLLRSAISAQLDGRPLLSRRLFHAPASPP